MRATFGDDFNPSFVTPFRPARDAIEHAVSSDDTQANIRGILDHARGRRIVLLSGRIDPTKNIPDGIRAFRRMLQENPDLQGEAMLLVQAPLSRHEDEYEAENALVQAEIEVANASFPGTPVMRDHDHAWEESLAALSVADVVMVLDDPNGQNLVLTEAGIVNGNDAVGVSTPNHGSFRRLGDITLRVEPHDIEGIATALATALRMDPEERATRFAFLRKEALQFTDEPFLEQQLRVATASPDELRSLHAEVGPRYGPPNYLHLRALLENARASRPQAGVAVGR
jgi:trehalose-6-phosphate synthase